MIEIICDQYELYTDADFNSLITEPFQFEDALETIKKHAERGDSLRIVVRNPALFDWFDAAIKYGAKKYIIDPVIELANHLEQQVMPEYLKKNPHWVVELGLVKKSKNQPFLGNSIGHWLKTVLLGKIWGKNDPFAVADLSEIFDFLIHSVKSTLHPLEENLITDCLTYWSQTKSDNAELFTWLKASPSLRAKYFVWEQVLSSFPEDKVSAWLQHDNAWYELTLFPNRHKLPRLDVPIQLPESITSFAKSFLEEEWKASPVNALYYVSGTMEFEKNFLAGRLRKQLHDELPISDTVYNKLLEFSEFSDVSTLARQLRPADKPSELLPSSPISRVQKWLDAEYLPFYDSCALLGLIDLTEPYVQGFHIWLKQHYTDMLFGESMAYSNIAKLKEDVMAGIPLLIIIFDGLDYICARDELMPELQEDGLFPSTDMVPYFSFLPTQTYISKPALVAGKMKSQIPDEIPAAFFYKELLQDCLGIPESDIRSKTDRDGSLLELIQESASVYLYLDNHLDQELLHKNYRQYLRRKKYSEYVKNQAKEIIQCKNDFKDMYDKSLQIVVTSDHGYTVIPKGSDIIDVPLAKTGKVRTILSAEMGKDNTLDPGKIWELNSDLYGLNEATIIPRGYTCFNRRPHGGTHGGCTPQEMAVPWIILNENRPEPPKELIFAIEGDVFRKRADNPLSITISNPNEYQIMLVELNIEGIDIISSIPKRVDGNTVESIDIKYDASEIVKSYANFSISYCYNSISGRMKKKLTIKVPTTGAMTTEFDDDFEF